MDISPDRSALGFPSPPTHANRAPLAVSRCATRRICTTNWITICTSQAEARLRELPIGNVAKLRFIAGRLRRDPPDHAITALGGIAVLAPRCRCLDQEAPPKCDRLRTRKHVESSGALAVLIMVEPMNPAASLAALSMPDFAVGRSPTFALHCGHLKDAFPRLNMGPPEMRPIAPTARTRVSIGHTHALSSENRWQAARRRAALATPGLARIIPRSAKRCKCELELMDRKRSTRLCSHWRYLCRWWELGPVGEPHGGGCIGGQPAEHHADGVFWCGAQATQSSCASRRDLAPWPISPNARPTCLWPPHARSARRACDLATSRVWIDAAAPCRTAAPGGLAVRRMLGSRRHLRSLVKQGLRNRPPPARSARCVPSRALGITLAENIWHPLPACRDCCTIGARSTP